MFTCYFVFQNSPDKVRSLNQNELRHVKETRKILAKYSATTVVRVRLSSVVIRFQVSFVLDKKVNLNVTCILHGKGYSIFWGKTIRIFDLIGL